MPIKIPSRTLPGRSAALTLATPARLERPSDAASPELLERGRVLLQQSGEDRALRLAQAAHDLHIDVPVLAAPKGVLEHPGDTVAFNLDTHDAHVFATGVRELHRTPSGQSSIRPAASGGWIAGIIAVDRARSRGIYVATFVVSVNQSEMAVEGYVRIDDMEPYQYLYFKAPVILAKGIGVLGFKIDRLVPEIEVGLHFPAHSSSTVAYFRGGELTKMS